MTDQTPAPTTFATLNLSKELVAALTELGYEEPTPIQRESIPPLLEGKDLIGQAATGTGKTAAFALPIIQRIANTPPADRPKPAALILVPTRELAMQVAEAMHKYGHRLRTSVMAIYGGAPFGQQQRTLERGVDIVVATPGRAVDHIRRQTIDLSRLSVLCLDEADEMLDMGFAEDLETILNQTPAETRQTVFFSATLPPRIAGMVKRHQRDPVRIQIAKEPVAKGAAPKVRQTAYIIPRRQKLDVLGRVLDLENPASAIVFCRTRTEVDDLTERLSAHGYRAQSLHGGIAQEQRTKVIKRLRDGAIDLVIATDVAARGLDIEQLELVVNFDVPVSPDSYVHRIGRVGRAGREGVAITLADPRESRLLKIFERVTKGRIEIAQVPTVADLRARRLELTRTALEDTIRAGNLDTYRAALDPLAAEHDLMTIALAAVKLAHQATGGEPDTTDDEYDQRDSRDYRDQRDYRDNRGPRDHRDHRPPARPSAPARQPAPAREPAPSLARTREEPSPAETAPPRVGEGGGEGSAQPQPRPIAPPREQHEKREQPPERKPHPPKEPRQPQGPSRSGLPTARIYIALGRMAHIRPQDIVGAITNEANIPGHQIGAIEIAEKYSLVEVPVGQLDHIIRALSNTTLKGRKPTVRRFVEKSPTPPKPKKKKQKNKKPS